MTFVEAVNRVLRSNGRLGADDDDVTFTDTAHEGTITLCRIAIQDELNDFISDIDLPYEVTTGSITTVPGTATYALATDFVRFYGDIPKLYHSVGNRYLYEFAGGLDALANGIPNYATSPGDPNWWYFSPTTTKRLGFYQVPTAAVTYSYEYERNVGVEEPGDTLPFHNELEAQTFCQAAGRRFKALSEESPDVERFILRDPSYTTAKARLLNLMKGKNPRTRYGALLR